MPPSRSGFHSPRRAGFTLKELLAVVVVLGLLVAVLFPSITAALNDRVSNSLLQQGSELAKELVTRRLAGVPVEEVYPMTSQNGGRTEYASSTDYFHHLIQAGILKDRDYSLFGGMGPPPVGTTDPARFTARNNSWNIVVDAPTAKLEETPLLFSRNLVLPDNRLPVGDDVNLQSLIESTSDRCLSFSQAYLIVVTISASGNSIRLAKDLGPGKAHLLNPTAHRLPVLRP